MELLNHTLDKRSSGREVALGLCLGVGHGSDQDLDRMSQNWVWVPVLSLSVCLSNFLSFCEMEISTL